MPTRVQADNYRIPLSEALITKSKKPLECHTGNTYLKVSKARDCIILKKTLPELKDSSGFSPSSSCAEFPDHVEISFILERINDLEVFSRHEL